MRTVCTSCPDFDPSDPHNFGARHVLCAACRARVEHPSTPPPPTVFCLLVEYPLTGNMHVMTFGSSFDRALQMVMLSSQPVVMKTKDF